MFAYAKLVYTDHSGARVLIGSVGQLLVRADKRIHFATPYGSVFSSPTIGGRRGPSTTTYLTSRHIYEFVRVTVPETATESDLGEFTLSSTPGALVRAA